MFDKGKYIVGNFIQEDLKLSMWRNQAHTRSWNEA